MTPLVVGEDHGHLLIESALHSLLHSMIVVNSVMGHTDRNSKFSLEASYLENFPATKIALLFMA